MKAVQDRQHGAQYVPAGYDPDLYRIRHSAAHIMAQAVLDAFPEARLAIGPPIKDGFYYDFDLPRPLTPDDLSAIEARMRAIISGSHPFTYRALSAHEAKALFADQPYKLELIAGLEQGDVDENGERVSEPPELSIYTHATFTDLCRGPHVAHTGEIDPDAVKLLSASGAYWRGDEHNPMLQRIYGTAWRTPDELAHYLHLREEAERRDHRRLGKALELFHLDATAPGMPYWLPNGLTLFNTLLAFWREELAASGYQEISTPLINERRLYDISGHWDHYREGMFLMPEDEHSTYCVKPMNCPNAMVVFNLKTRSYRDLPLRLSDCGTLHRNERSGALHGLLRVQKFHQDDSHIFVTPEQVEAEYARVFALIDHVYGVFGLSYRYRLGTRPPDFMGDPETWERAEAILKGILDHHAGPGNYQIEEADGAFYGPKVDIVMQDALGREWQVGTVQLDFQLPRRFNCVYTDADGEQKTPAVIHNAVYGTLERFIGILIEHTAGAFPVWLAPLQARVLPVTDDQRDYATDMLAMLRRAGLRAEIDTSGERMAAMIRSAQMDKVPYMLVVGKREAANGTVSVRLRSEQDLGAMPLDAFLDGARAVIDAKSLELWGE